MDVDDGLIMAPRAAIYLNLSAKSCPSDRCSELSKQFTSGFKTDTCISHALPVRQRTLVRRQFLIAFHKVAFNHDSHDMVRLLVNLRHNGL